MIKLENITAGYQDGDVLKGISIEVCDGENIAIIGPNGCGKTTLLKTIAGLMPFKGEITIDGRSVRKMNRKELAKKIAMLSQITNMCFNYTVFDTVLMGRYIHKSGGALGGFSQNDRDIAEKALKTVGMWQYRDRETDMLSGGELQRVFLAKALAQEPDIILLDEPTNHLDLSCQADLIAFLKQWSKDTGRTVVGVLHDINLATMLSDKLILMDSGLAVCYGDHREVLTSQNLSKTYKMDVAAFMREMLGKWQEVSN